MSKRRIKKLSQKFSNTILGNLSPYQYQGWCMAMSYTLHVYLRIHGIQCRVIRGMVDHRTHFWIELIGKKSYILDPTINQFFPKSKSIYLGRIKEGFNIINADEQDSFVYDLLIHTLTFPEGRSAFSEPDRGIQIKIDELYMFCLKAAKFNSKSAKVINNTIYLQMTEMTNILEDSEYKP